MKSIPDLRRSGRSHRARLLALLATPLLGLSLIAAVPSPAAPVTTADESSSPTAAGASSAPLEADPVTITLVTGDRVSVAQSGDGEWQMVDAEAAPRPDGSVPGFEAFGMTGDGSYVVPDDVRPLIGEDLLDLELFNVGYLAEHGYGDEARDDLPVIVEYADSIGTASVKRDSRRLPASEQTVTLGAINAAGVAVDKTNADEFWGALLADQPADDHRAGEVRSRVVDLAGEIEKVWLDQVAYIDLEESVPQVGAPQAWDAGYTGEGVTVAVLDTGIDTSHPDLDGKVSVSENFVGDGEPVDDHGHGTHVAATVAGSGAASDGARRGVAPDAELVSGKVCNANGQCPVSVVMAGMEWAARVQGADVINMSLGSRAASNGLNLQSQLVNQLSAETGALFVTSAGNSGPGSPSVGSPAAADAALAVGAVDKADQLAEFSSRGPRLEDRAIKPEITAPGVGIVAARADGTGIGVPVDEHYTSVNGTSMASPHVAGAAAILAQQHPDWGPTELKAALVASATTTGRLSGTITSGPYDDTTYTVSSGSATSRIDTAISGTPTFVGHGCDPLDASSGIALVERGPSSDPCSFQEKLDHIAAAGYEAGIVFNQPGSGCLDELTMEAAGDIPFVFVNRLTGLQLLQQPDLTEDNACATESADPGTEVAATTIAPGAAGDYTVYEQGAGRLDVARAVSNQVQVSPATADFRFAPFDQQEPLEPQTLTYTNTSDAPVTLDLTATLSMVGGDAVPEDVLSLDQETVTVPASGTSTVLVTLDHSALESGQYSGRIVAADDTSGTQLTTPVGFVRGHDLHNVTITVETGQGQALHSPNCFPSFCHASLFPVDVPFVEDATYNPTSISCVDGEAATLTCRKYELEAEVPAGTYNLYVIDIGWITRTGAQSTGFDNTWFLRPGIVVGGDTDVAFHTDELTNETPVTHRPSHTVGLITMLNQRQAGSAGTMTGAASEETESPSGIRQWLAQTSGDAGYFPARWVTPTEPVTVGEFNVGSNWQMLNRLVEMTVRGPDGFDLTTAAYPDYRPLELAEFISRSGWGSVRFSGTQTLPVVDVGVGSAGDFAGRDVAGALVLMQVEPTMDPPIELGSCPVRPEQLRNALDAGAAGVLMSNPHGTGLCSIRPGAWTSFRHNDIEMPWVSLSVAEADRLRGLLKDGAVTIRVADTSDDEYAYFLSFIYRNGVPDSLPSTVTANDVTERETYYHRAEPGIVAVDFTTHWTDVGFAMGNGHVLLGPTVRTEYIGVNAPSAWQFWQVGQGHLPPNPQSWVTSILADRRDGSPMHWNAAPVVVPGAAARPFTQPSIEIGKDPSSLYHWCSGCRAGNIFKPTWARTSTDPRQVGHLWRFGPYLGYTNDTVELYREGQKIPLTQAADKFGSSRPVFELVPELAEYELRLNSPDTGVTTTWEFTSEMVTSDEMPEGLNCLFVGPCRAEPLVYLRYDAGVDPDNTVQARGAHRMTVTAYHQDPDGPAIAGLKLWVSDNGGDQWREAKVRPLGDGQFEALTVYRPAHRRGSDTISLKAEAWDADGNRVEQTVLDAYSVRDHAPNRGPNQPN